MTDRFLRHLPVGERVEFSADGIPGWDIFPFEGDLRVKPLQSPVLPEPPRHGEDGPASCSSCQDPSKGTIWADERWRVYEANNRPAIPVKVLLSPLAHHDSADLPPDLSAELGPMLQRVERAIVKLGGIGRVHVARYGDGASHLHYWLMARPAGMMQLRGSVLLLWDDVLPKQDEAQSRVVLRELAANLAADGGTAYA